MDERSFQRLLRRTVAIPVALLVLLAVVLVVEILSLMHRCGWSTTPTRSLPTPAKLCATWSTWSPASGASNSRETETFLEPFVSAKSQVAGQHRSL